MKKVCLLLKMKLVYVMVQYAVGMGMLILNSSVSTAQVYNVGDTISQNDQVTAFEVCYGDYPQDSIRLVDMNGAYNRGDYTITFIAMQVALCPG